MRTFIILGIITVLLVSCNVSPQPIQYGTDACHYCNMTIVNKQHASQIVTKKGKAFKYDATECMIRSIQDEFKNTEIALYLTSDFSKPGELVDATKATYLVSSQITSPMGANLSAYSDKNEAQKAQEKFTGTLFSWEEIQNQLKK